MNQDIINKSKKYLSTILRIPIKTELVVDGNEIKQGDIYTLYTTRYLPHEYGAFENEKFGGPGWIENIGDNHITFRADNKTELKERTQKLKEFIKKYSLTKKEKTKYLENLLV